MSKWEDLFSNPERFMRYDGQFLYPPRIEYKLQPASLAKLDNGEYIGQPKLNGSNTSVTISPTSVVAKERHNTFFAIPPKFDFKSLYSGSGYMCLGGEFMNKSKKDDTGKPFYGFCIWDIMAYDNKILMGSTIEERSQLLKNLYKVTGEISVGGIVYLYKTETPGIYIVNNFYGNFLEDYKTLSKVDMVEGFVLKRKNGKLEAMTREQNNTGWSVKVRKPTQNYLFEKGGEVNYWKSFYGDVKVGDIIERIGTIGIKYKILRLWNGYEDGIHPAVWAKIQQLKLNGEPMKSERPRDEVVKANYQMSSSDRRNWDAMVERERSKFRDGGTVDVGTKIGMIRGEHRGEKGYVKEIDTTYKVKLGNEIVDAHKGDFYNDED